MCTANSAVVEYSYNPSIVLNEVLPKPWHVSEDCELFDVGETFSFISQRRNKTLRTTYDNVCLIDFKFIGCAPQLVPPFLPKQQTAFSHKLPKEACLTAGKSI